MRNATTIFLMFILCPAISIAEDVPEEPAGELVTNGEFNQGIDGWGGKRVTLEPDGGNRIVDAPEFVAFETDDGVGEKKGCLRIQFSDINQKCVPRKSGAYLQLDKNIPPDTEVVIRFYAKSMDGSRRLSIARPSGGATAGPVYMNDQWRQYTLRYKSEHNTPGFFFVITDHYGRRHYLEPGIFLLDKISVKIVE